MMRNVRQNLLILLLLTVSLCAAASDELDYAFDNKDNYFWIPKTYTVEEVIHFLGEPYEFLHKPEDLFVDDKGLLYVADTGNDRVIRFTDSYAVDKVFHGPQGQQLSRPGGIFVDADGDLYIADTGNSRILHLGPDGSFVEEFTKPDSSLLSDEYPFKPTKVGIDSVGYLYIQNADDYHGLISIDSYNRFRGYVAPARVKFDLGQKLVSMFATSEQKAKLSKALPPYHSNFHIDGGDIYCTTVYTDRDQIKKINAVGNNNYIGDVQRQVSVLGIPVDSYSFFGDDTDMESDEQIVPMFVDLAVDDGGIITAIESTRQQLYQYDQDGKLLTVFGGKGDRKGLFKSAVSIVSLPDNRLAVLDKEMGTIQIFKPTAFINTVHTAIALQYDGKYDQALVPWQEVLKINPNYSIALSAMGKIYYKQELWKESVDSYYEAENATGYSEAFNEYRHEFYRTHFLLVTLLIVSVTVALVKLVGALKRRSDMLLDHIIRQKDSV